MRLFAQSAQNACYPQSVKLVPLSEKANLQAWLDSNRAIRLEAGDYRTGGPASITLQSNQEIYGHPAITKIPPITMVAGTTNSVIQNVDVSTITCQGGAPIKENLFKRITNATILATDANFQNNLVLWTKASRIVADNRVDGSFKNNRIIRFENHSIGIGMGKYSIELRGNSALTSGGNVFLDTVFLTPKGDTVYADNQTDLTFACWNAESWCWGDLGERLMEIGPMGTFRVFNGGGGDTQAAPYWGVLDVAATNYVDLGDALISRNQTAVFTFDLNLKSSVQNALTTMRYSNWSVMDYNLGGNRFDIFNGNSYSFMGNGTSYSTPITGAMETAMRTLVMTARTGVTPWESAEYEAVPDPAGPNWNVDLASKPDSSALLQSYIDNGQVIPPGIYYIDSSLRMHDYKLLMGSGQDKTCVIAKSPSLDIVVGDDHADPAYGTTAQTPIEYKICDITLQGGREGLATAAEGSGGWAYITRSTVSHVTFRNLSGSGIHADRINAWDNNLIDNCNFVDCATAGFKETVASGYSGGNAAGMCYLDKVVFYKCQFIRCGIGADLKSVRGNNLDAFINCVFVGNTTNAATLERNAGTNFANCLFLDNGGNPTIKTLAGLTQGGHFINCYFRAPATGTSSVFGTFSNSEGCTFDANGNSAAVLIAANPSCNNFYNCSSSMPIGARKNGVYLNNYFASGTDANFSREAVTVVSGTVYAQMPNSTDSSSPKPQLLYGEAQRKQFGLAKGVIINAAKKNGDFEGTGSGGFSPWAQNNLTAVATGTNAPGPTSGAYYVTLSGTATSTSALVSKLENRDIAVDSAQGTTFNISFDACKSAGDGYDRVVCEIIFLKNGTTDTVVQSFGTVVNSLLTTSYQRFNATIQPTGTDWDEIDVRIAFRKNTPVTGTAYGACLDNVVLTQLSP